MIEKAVPIAALVSLLAWAGGLRAAPLPEPAARERAEALNFERQGQWERACESYLRLLSENRDQPDLREHLALCLRHLRQSRRHGDSVYRAYVAALPLSQALTLYSEALTTLQRSYADPQQVTLDKLYHHGLDELQFGLSDPVFCREQLAGVEPAAIAAWRDRLIRDWSLRSVSEVRDARQAARDLAWEAQQLTGIDPSVVVLELACGACHALDEYTLFVAPIRSGTRRSSVDTPTESWRLPPQDMDLAAYGLTLTNRGGLLVVERVSAGSWATGQNIQPGDRITSVGKSLDRLSLDAALDCLRGERSPITDLTLTSATGESRKLVLPESLPSVFDAGLERNGVGYIRIANFQRTTPQDFDSAVLRLRSEGMRALVLDLRGNPGGSFLAAVQIVERFVAQGVIVSTQGHLAGLSKTFTGQNSATLTDMPTVVLVDADTASAAEVVAGALKDQQRAVLVGQPTFGKDTIQRLLQLNEGAAIRLTLARFLLPGGKRFAGTGISPNVYEPRRDPMHDYQYDSAIEQATRLISMR